MQGTRQASKIVPLENSSYPRFYIQFLKRNHHYSSRSASYMAPCAPLILRTVGTVESFDAREKAPIVQYSPVKQRNGRVSQQVS